MDSKYTINKNNNNYNNKTNNRNNNDDNNKNNDNNDKNNKHNDLNDKNFNYNVNFLNNFNKTSNIEELITHNNNNKQMNINGNLSNTNAFNNFANNLVMGQSQMRQKLENFQRAGSYNEMLMDNQFKEFNLRKLQSERTPQSNVKFDNTNRINPYNKKKCNMASCKKCNVNWQPRSRNEWNNPNNQNNIIPPKKFNKYCLLNCHWCTKKISDIENQIYFSSSTHKTNGNSQQPSIEQNENFIIPSDKFLSEDLTVKNPTEVESQIKQLIKRNFNKSEIKGDGNCLYYSILAYLDLNQDQADNLRNIIVDEIEKDQSLDLTTLTEENHSSKTELIEHMRTRAYYAGYLELVVISRLLDTWIAVYLENNRYHNNRWQIIKLNESQCKDVIFLSTNQDLDPSSPKQAHYNCIRPASGMQSKVAKNNLIELLGLNRIIEHSKINCLTWNLTSIRSYAKKTLLGRILYEHNIHIALLSETFLIKEDKFTMKDYFIYRSDNTTRRKGCAILVRNDLQCIINVLENCQSGRFVKIRLKDKSQQTYCTVASCYLESTCPYDRITIPTSVISSDLISGDLNDHPTGLNRMGLYHHKGMSNIIEIEAGNASHHKPFISTAEIPIAISQAPLTKRIQSKKLREDNMSSVEQFLFGKTGTLYSITMECKHRNKSGQHSNVSSIR